MHDWTDMPLSQIPSQSTASLHEIAESALFHGINHFETAHGYGSSERQLGVVLKNFNRDDLILQTKVAPHRDTKIFIHNFHESLDRMQQEYVNLLAIHGINDYQSLWESCRKGGCLHAARKLQQEGKALHIGFSGHGPLDVILEAVNHEEDGGFDFINVHWYYIFDINRPAIERAKEKDMGVYIISPTDKGGMLYNPPPIMEELCEPISPILFNDTYCLTQPGVSSISVGAAKISDFDEHLKSLDFIHEDSRPDEILQIIQALEERMKRVTGYRRPEGLWTELPSWGKSPGNINMQFIQWLGNLAKGWHLEKFAAARYGMLSEGSSWVPGNNAATTGMLSFTDIQKKFPAVTEQFLNELRETHRVLSAIKNQ